MLSFKRRRIARRHTSLIPLSDDHYTTLLIAENLKKDSHKMKGYPTHPEDKCVRAGQFFAEYFLPHVLIEEEILFSFLRGKDEMLEEIIEELTEEHQQIRNCFEALYMEMDHLIPFMNELGNLLEQHVRKEECILFRRVQRILPSSSLADLGIQIQAFKSMMA